MRKALAISLVLVTLTVCILALVHWTRKEVTQTALDAIEVAKSVLKITPQVQITSTVTLQETKDILELASKSQQLVKNYNYEASWMGSTKVLRLQGQYTIKAGFDLKDRFNVQVDEQSKRIRADFPPARILSVQLDDYKVLEDSSGWWNRLNPKDQEAALNQMNQQVRDEASRGDLLRAAEDSLRDQLNEQARKHEQTWEVTFRK